MSTIRLSSRKPLAAALASITVLAGHAPVQAQDIYVSGSVGIGFPSTVTNQGAFTSAFTTGSVTGVTPPLTLQPGAPVNWRTELDNGTFGSLALGFHTSLLRYELEYSTTRFDIDTHRGVNAGGIDLSGIDAGVLLTGNVGDLGVNVAGLVASDTGRIEASAWMLNAFHDFDTGTRFTPYVGLGLGLMRVDLTYRPSDVGVNNDSDEVFAYQLVGGVSYAVNDNLSVFGSYRYRDSRDARIRSALLPATFKIAGNSSSTVDVGIRYSF